MRRRMPIFYSALMLTGVNLLLRFVSTSFQVHISARIGAEGVGLLQLVMSVGSLAMTAGMAGVRTSTMYLTAEELGKNRPQNVHWVLRSCWVYSLIFSGGVAFIIYTAAPWLAANWIGEPGVAEAVRLFAVFLPLVVLSGCMSGYFTAANRIGTLAAVEVFEQLCYMAVTMCALNFWAGSDPQKACRAVVLGSGISACVTLMCLTALRIGEKAPRGPRLPVAERLLHTAIPLALADDLKVGINTLENLMVPKRLALYPGEASPLAAFGTVCGMVFPVLMFPAAILFALAELLIPELARCAAAESRRRIQYLAKRSLRLAVLYGCLCGGILFLTAEDLCYSLYGSSDAGQYLKLYALLAPMLYCDAIVDAMNKGLGQQKICVRYNILTAAMDVALLFLLLPKFGMRGYFASFFITHLVNFGFSLRLLLKTADIRIPFYIACFTASASLAAILGAGFVGNLPGRVLSFVTIWGCLLVLLRVVSKSDIRWLKGLIYRKQTI